MATRPMTEQHTLHAAAQDIAQLVTIDGAHARLTDAGFETAQQRLEQVVAGERKQVAYDLVALALQAQQLAGESSAPLVVQLYTLVGQIIVDRAEAQMMFETDGVDLERATTAPGNAASKLPVASSSPSAGKSLFSLRTGEHKE